MAKKEEIYSWIRIGGLLSFLPFVLASGPCAGYFLGEFISHLFKIKSYVVIVISIAIGSAVSIREAVRIIAKVMRLDRGSAK